MFGGTDLGGRPTALRQALRQALCQALTLWDASDAGWGPLPPMQHAELVGHSMSAAIGGCIVVASCPAPSRVCGPVEVYSGFQLVN